MEKCDKENYIVHDSTHCVASDNCHLKSPFSLIFFTFTSLVHWIIVVSLIFVLLHFRLDITAGYAYGMLFYYSVLGQTVNASYNGTHNNLNSYAVITYISFNFIKHRYFETTFSVYKLVLLERS